MVHVVTGQAYGGTVNEMGFVGQPPLAYERCSCVEHPVSFMVQVEGGMGSAFVGCTITSYYYYNIIVENGRNSTVNHLNSVTLLKQCNCLVLFERLFFLFYFSV